MPELAHQHPAISVDRRRARLGRAVALAVLLVVLVAAYAASPTLAATYNVSICGIGTDAGSGDGLSYVDPGNIYMFTVPICKVPNGIIKQEADLPSISYTQYTWSGDGHWTLSAPANTTIDSLSMNRTFTGVQSYLTYELRTADNRLLEGAATYNGYGVPASGARVFPVNSTSVTGHFWCAQAGGCTGTGTNIRLSALAPTMSDTSNPTLNSAPAGPLLTPGSVHGTQNLTFDASDLGGGVYRAVVLVDGVAVRSYVPDSNGGHCAQPYIYLAPCKAHVTGATPIDTTQLSEGAHQVKLEVYDATDVNKVASTPQAFDVDNIPAPSGGVPQLLGAARDASQLTADPGAWSGAVGAYGYEYLRCDAQGGNCSVIAGADGDQFTLGAIDIGHTLRVRVTATNSAGESAQATSQPTAIVAPQAPLLLAGPAIPALVQVRQLLTSTTGTWSGTPSISYSFRWRRCDQHGACAWIDGASAATYTPGAADVGMSLQVEVTATNAGGSASALSLAASEVAPLAPTSTRLPAIVGAARDGLVLIADDGSFDGVPAPSISRVWERCAATCEAIDGANATTYTPGAQDVGTMLQLAVTATNAGGSVTVRSERTSVVAAMAPAVREAPAIASAATEGVALSASSGVWEGTAPVHYAYAWLQCPASGSVESCTAVAGATDASYVPAVQDLGSRLRVKVTAINAAGTSTAISDPTRPTAARPPVNTAAPSIAGIARDAQTLSAQLGTWSGTPQIALQPSWLRCDPAGSGCSLVSDSTQTYELGADDVGHTIRLRVHASNAGDDASALSPASDIVLARGPRATTQPHLEVSPSDRLPDAETPTVAAGAVLTISGETWEGTSPLAYTVAWQRCALPAMTTCTTIAGATGRTYTTSEQDSGAAIRATITATNIVGQAQAVTDTVGVIAASVGILDPGPATQDGDRLQAVRLMVAAPARRCGAHPRTPGRERGPCTASLHNVRRLVGLTGRPLRANLQAVTVGGPPLVGATLRITAAGKERRVRTDGSGRAAITLAPDARGTLKVVFDGDADHAPAHSSIPILVEATSTLALKPDPPGHARFIGRLRGPRGSPAGTRLSVDYRAHDGTWHAIGTTRAARDGTWSLRCPRVVPAGSLLVRARIAPSSTYPYDPAVGASAIVHLPTRRAR